MISKLAPYKTLDAIYSFADSHRKAFLGKFTAEQYFKSLEDKSNSLELPAVAFSSVYWKSKRFDKLDFI